MICAEARAWLEALDESALEAASFVTSMPDVSELEGATLETWRAWFVETATVITSKCPPSGVAIFYQTDVLRHGAWIDKSHLCHLGAERAGAHLLWHKVVLRAEAGSVTEGRPGYAHLLCYSRGVRTSDAAFSADVIADAGTMDWSRAMGRNVCNIACEWVRAHTTSRVVIDPFCGTGTVLAAANDVGLEALGVDLDAARVERARRRR